MAETPRAAARIDALDVVRGVAVGGILFANVLVFFGLFVRPPAEGLTLPGGSLDAAARVVEAVLVEGKFYSIFSLLFGIGFGLQLGRGGDDSVTRFRRRLRILLAIGAVHAIFLWAGDILMLYALLGLTLPWFARQSDAHLLRWIAGLLATHTTLYLIALMIWTLVAPSAAAVDAPSAPGPPPEILRLITGMGTGGIGDAFLGNLVFLVGRWMELVATMRFPKVLGMFLLGLWLVRRGVVQNLSAHRPLLVRWARLGVLIGLPANVFAVWAFSRAEYLPPSIAGLAGVVAQAIGFPLLAIGYACTVALLSLGGSRLVAPFAPVGRMALTNYLMQSVICVVLSYGFGFGLWWRISVVVAFAIAAAIIAMQMLTSRWWRRRFGFGPAEWLWRRLTYRQPLPLRRHPPRQHREPLGEERLRRLVDR